jgi:uncharacterized protein YbjT (DUF2867 family)
MPQDAGSGKREDAMNLWIVGGEETVRAAVREGAEGAGVAAQPGEEHGFDAGGDDVVIDLGLAPRSWRAGRLAADAAKRAGEVGRRAAGARRVVCVSVLGASAEASAEWRRAGAAAESALREAGAPMVALRVGLLLGDCGLAAVLRRAVERSKLLPLPGIERARIEPLALPDLAAYCVAAALADRELDDAYDLGCGEMLTGGLLVRGLADNLGLARWIVPAPAMAAGWIARLGADEERPRGAVGIWLEALAGGMLPRGTRAWEHFAVEPTSLRQAMADATGMVLTLRRRGDGKFGDWRAPRKKGILWSGGRTRKR